MVIFCTKSPKTPLKFRDPTIDDYLGSNARETFLQLQYEVKLEELLRGGDDRTLLTKDNTYIMDEWHRSSALGHWQVMRWVLPPKIWELW